MYALPQRPLKQCTDVCARLGFAPPQPTTNVAMSFFGCSRSVSIGDTLLFTDRSSSVASLWTYSLQDKKLAPFDAVRSHGILNGAFSPDGRWIAYASAEVEGT